MDVHAFFGSTFDCPCGRRHVILPRRVLIADDAVARMDELCAGLTPGRRVAVLMDARTRDVAGQAVADALAIRWQVERIVIPDPPTGSPVCDDLTRDALAGRLGPARQPATARPAAVPGGDAVASPVDLIVPVGSGVLCDLGKWLAFERSVPFVPLATAASMNGYASGNVAATLDGVKSLFVGAPPPAVAACPAILAAAPYELTAAGLGDALAKSVSSADWLLNHVLFGDFYCQAAVDVVADIEPLYADHPADLAARAPTAMRALLDALLVAGSAMTMAGSSAPASGGEHLLSHTLDMMSTLDGGPHDLHGRQVGLGTVLCSEVYRRVLAIESPRFFPPCETIDATFWGRLAEPIAKLYAQKVPRLHQVKAVLSGGGVWDELRRRLAPGVRAPETISGCLQAARAAWRAGDIGCDRPRLLAAFSHAHQARSRFTVMDLAYLLGLLPGAASETIDRWA